MDLAVWERGPNLISVLVLNAGSSSLKWQIIRLSAKGSPEASDRVCRGKITQLGGTARVRIEQPGIAPSTHTPVLRDLRAAADWLLAWLAGEGLAFGGTEQAHIEAVGHRVVHGGQRFRGPARIDAGVRGAIEEGSRLAPLHNPLALACIAAVESAWGAAVAQVAVFDTAFHTTLPEPAFRYAIPERFYRDHGMRRYGFHGISHQYAALRYGALTQRPAAQTNLISLHLGNGCSVTAIRAGQSIDTSMGLTPLEGLVMGTRSGDLDPAVLSRICAETGLEAAAVETLLNRESGLLALSGLTSDMQQLLARSSDPRAALAVEVFCHRARKYLGAMLAAARGADAVVFTGGIGENCPEIRARICDGMDWAGLRLDLDRNARMIGTEGAVGASGSAIQTFVIPADEEWMIARETAACLEHACS